MSINNVEYLGYSWYGNGLFLDQFKNIKKREVDNIFLLNYDKFNNFLRQINALNTIKSKSYIISVCGIFKKNLFYRILSSNRPFLRRWSKFTPFDFEKRWDDTWILPIIYGIPKFEMFASIDDDNKHPGSSLISRGYYRKRITRAELLKIEKLSSSRNKSLKLIFIVKKIIFFPWLKNLLKRITYHF
jgi:hypothetical protein